MKTSIVIPTYNEQTNIVDLIPAIFALGVPHLELIIVDDHSPDGTARVVAELQSRYPALHLIERAGKYGLGSAYITGFTEALRRGAGYIIQMDADFSHAPADIPRLLLAAETADLVIGSRKIAGGRIRGWGPIRRAMSSGAMWLSRLALGLHTRDVTSGFRSWRSNILQTINLQTIGSSGYAFQEEMLYLAESLNLRVVEIPVTFVDRQAGRSKLSNKDILEFFSTLRRLARQR